MDEGRFKLMNLVPVAAVAFALWAMLPAIDVWSYAASGKLYDEWRDSARVHAGEYALSRAMVAAAFALLCWRKQELRKLAIAVIVVSAAAVVLFRLGLQHVSFVPDG